MSNTPHIEGQCAVHRSPFHQSLGRSSGSIDAMREGLPACGLRVVRTVRHTLLNATIAAAVAVAAPDVFATEGKQAQSTTESPDSGTSASSAESTVLEPVTVTARKTTERLQDVPESITVLQAKTLKESPFDPGVAIAGHAPNVQWVSRATGSQWFSIRGVSSLYAVF